MVLPRYYSSLAPFRSLFQEGPALLTYHHVGTTPRGARIKGLYISPRLFARQMAELAAAGFATPPYDEITEPAPNAGARVFVTFDDGFQDVLEHARPVLQRHGFRAIQFLVANRLGGMSEWQTPSGEVAGRLMDQEQIREWLAAGHAIGSHTLHHPYLTRISPAEAREEIHASKRKLEDLFGRAISHFAYPYGDWDPRIRDQVQEAGYRTACTTEFGVNTPPVERLALRRITARYPSRNLKTLRTWLQSKLAGSGPG